MSIIVILLPIHIFLFFLLELSFINLKNHYIHSTKGDNIYLPFQKAIKISTNNFKIDIKGISRRVKIFKNIISAFYIFLKQ